MNWEAIGAIGEILGALAVVATLVYLTVQLRQNSLQLRLGSFQTAAHNYSGRIIDVLSDPRTLPVFRKGLQDFEALDADEQALFHAKMLGFQTTFATNWQLYEAGVIPQSLYQGWANDWVRILKCPGAARWWAAFGAFDPILRDHVDRLLAESDLAPLNQVVSFLRAP